MTHTNDLAERLRMRLDRESGMENLVDTVLKYGYIQGTRYSLDGHEFQRELLADTSSRIAVRKCSQVGLSEVMVQKLLAMSATMRHIRVIFTLPTKEMAVAFSKDRIDGAIDQSDFYSGMMDRATNSASQKKLGSCIIYVAGSFGANSAISVPAEIVINDEYDFSNQVVLGKLNSRLRHASIVDEYGQRGIKYMFSTPTVTGFGIDLEFGKGDQRYYMVKCEHCETWQNPDFNDFEVPGFTESMSKFGRDDTYNPDVKLSEAKILCPGCKRDLFSSLIQPERRQWIAKFPDNKEVRSYQVDPWAVPTFNTPAEIVRQMGQYPLKSDFYNFVLGVPYSDSDNTFTTDENYKALVKGAVLHPYMSSVVNFHTVIGLDIGKTCHMTVGIPMGKKLHVIWAEAIENSRDNPAAPQVLARYDWFRCVQMVIDSGPDISLVNALTSARRDVRAAVYVRSLSGPKIYEEKSSEPVVNIDRTKALTYLLAKHNSQEIMYPKDDTITNEIFQHLATTKKVRRQNPDGTFTEMFTKTDNLDHYTHSLNYLMIAMEMKFGMGAGSTMIYAPVGIGVVAVGSESESAQKAARDKALYDKYVAW